MSKKYVLAEDDKALFRREIQEVIPLVQTTLFSTTVTDKKKQRLQRYMAEQRDHSHYFSNNFQSLPMKASRVRFARENLSPSVIKKLFYGHFVPDIFLDLHGKTQPQAKRELGRLLNICYHRQLNCALIMHGHGQNILKCAIPVWLTQHPLVVAFHQSPSHLGGQAALLVLLNDNAYIK